ncbi:MAG: DUF3137 domain-containing protein, partial [Bacteroidota bacterium]
MPGRINLFRKQKENIWKKLSEEIGAEYIPAEKWKRNEKVIAKHENWTITIESYYDEENMGVMATKISAPYVNRDSFYFRIYKADFFQNLSVKLGMQDVIIGHE